MASSPFKVGVAIVASALSAFALLLLHDSGSRRPAESGERTDADKAKGEGFAIGRPDFNSGRTRGHAASDAPVRSDSGPPAGSTHGSRAETTQDVAHAQAPKLGSGSSEVRLVAKLSTVEAIRGVPIYAFFTLEGPRTPTGSFSSDLRAGQLDVLFRTLDPPGAWISLKREGGIFGQTNMPTNFGARDGTAFAIHAVWSDPKRTNASKPCDWEYPLWESPSGRYEVKGTVSLMVWENRDRVVRREIESNTIGLTIHDVPPQERAAFDAAMAMGLFANASGRARIANIDRFLEDYGHSAYAPYAILDYIGVKNGGTEEHERDDLYELLKRVTVEFPHFERMDEVLLWLGHEANAVGRTQEALGHWRQLLQMYPDGRLAERAREAIEEIEQPDVVMRRRAQRKLEAIEAHERWLKEQDELRRKEREGRGSRDN